MALGRYFVNPSYQRGFSVTTAIVIPAVQQITPAITAYQAIRSLRADIRAEISAIRIANGMRRNGRQISPSALAKIDRVARKPATVSAVDQRCASLPLS